MNDCSYIGLKPSINSNDKSVIVSSGNITETDKAVSANEIIDNTVVNDKSGNIQPSTYHNYNDTYSNAGNVDAGKTMIAFRSEEKADSAIDCEMLDDSSVNNTYSDIDCDVIVCKDSIKDIAKAVSASNVEISIEKRKIAQ